MRIILDTNILISALIGQYTPPDRLYEYWKEDKFDLVSCEQQLDELNRVSRHPFFRGRLKPYEVGNMINSIRRLASMYGNLPDVDLSPDPNDNFLLALAQIAKAEFLVTGDKSDLLKFERYKTTRIVTARALVEIVENLR